MQHFVQTKHPCAPLDGNRTDVYVFRESATGTTAKPYGFLSPFARQRFQLVSSTLSETDTASETLKCTIPPNRLLKLFIHGIRGIHG